MSHHRAATVLIAFAPSIARCQCRSPFPCRVPVARPAGQSRRAASQSRQSSVRRRAAPRERSLEEIAALRRFYVNASAAQGPEELVQAALELAGAKLRTDLHVGDVDIAAGLVGGGATEGVNQLPTAKLELDLRLLGSTPLDYWGPRALPARAGWLPAGTLRRDGAVSVTPRGSRRAGVRGRREPYGARKWRYGRFRTHAGRARSLAASRSGPFRRRNLA
jgi:hypothetical protein